MRRERGLTAPMERTQATEGMGCASRSHCFECIFENAGRLGIVGVRGDKYCIIYALKGDYLRRCVFDYHGGWGHTNATDRKGRIHDGWPRAGDEI